MITHSPSFNPIQSNLMFDRGRNWRAKLGFVLLAMEQTVESDIFRLLPPGIGAYFSRAPMANKISVESLTAMANGIGDAAALILPYEDIDVVCYACTSGSVVIGEEQVFKQLRRGAPKAHPTSLISAVMQALRCMELSRIAIATPYIDEVNAIEQRYLQERGFTVVNIEGLGIENDSDMARITADSLLRFGRHVDRADADGVFISCSALRSIEVIDQLEREIGKPVVTSNQAMLWHCLRLAGIEDKIQGYGRLLREH